MINHVSGETKADVMWRKLETIFERKHGVKQSFFVETDHMIMVQRRSKYVRTLNDFQGLINYSDTVNLKLDEEVQALLSFTSLPDSWETLVFSVMNSILGGVITL